MFARLAAACRITVIFYPVGISVSLRGKILVDFFIPQETRGDFQKLYRARFLVTLLIIGAVFWFSWTIVLLFIWTARYGTFGYPLTMLATFFIQLLALFRFRATGNFYVPTLIGSMPFVILTIWLVYMAGSDAGSVPLYAFFILTVLSFILLSTRDAVLSALFFGATHIVYILLPVFGFHWDTRFKHAADNPNLWPIFTAIFLLMVYGMLTTVCVAFRSLNRKLSEQLITDNQFLDQRSKQDPLTKLANRRFFHEFLDGVVGKSNIQSKPFSLLYIDLDNFKPVNDTHGHEAGDTVLKTISERLQQSVRSSDLVARLGGDEFAVILDGADTDLAREFSVNIINAIEVPIEEHGESFVLSASVGIACCPEHTADADLLVKYADKAMYKAKRENLPIYVSDK